MKSTGEIVEKPHLAHSFTAINSCPDCPSRRPYNHEGFFFISKSTNSAVFVIFQQAKLTKPQVKQINNWINVLKRK